MWLTINLCSKLLNHVKIKFNYQIENLGKFDYSNPQWYVRECIV
jgi:hypothetical protein